MRLGADSGDNVKFQGSAFQTLFKNKYMFDGKPGIPISVLLVSAKQLH